MVVWDTIRREMQIKGLYDVCMFEVLYVVYVKYQCNCVVYNYCVTNGLLEYAL